MIQLTADDDSPYAYGTGVAGLISEARSWLADCGWADEPDFAAMTDEQIRRGVQRHYDGGWAQFVSDAA